MSNFKIATKDDVKNAGFIFVKDVNTQEVKKIATSADFQVGLSNLPKDLTVTGKAIFTQGISGSLTRLVDNTSYLVAGSNITITSASNGQVTIATTGAVGDVAGPASATDDAIVRFDLTTGKLIQNSGVTIDDSNNITIPGDITVNGGDIIAAAATMNLVNAATTVNLGSTAVTRTTNIATGGAVQTVTLGSITGASSLTLQAGTGGILTPNQPAFLAYMSANQNNFAINTDVTVLFNSEVFDQAGNFNTTTYIFTAPVTGRYIFNVAVRLQTVDITATFYSLQLVTSNRIYRMGLIDPNFSANLVYWYLNGSVVVDMDINDTAYVRIYQSDGAVTPATDILAGVTASSLYDSYFSGFLLG